jgi:hypothetical protein
MAWSTCPVAIIDFLSPFKEYLKNNPGWKCPKITIMHTISPENYPTKYMVRGAEVYDLEAKENDNASLLDKLGDKIKVVEQRSDGSRPFFDEDYACDACHL